MKVIAGLAREHADFERLIRRLEESAAGAGAPARRAVRNNLLILLSALDRHEKVENVVFGEPRYSSREDARRLLEVVASQHSELQDLRSELLDAVADSQEAPIQRLRFLVRRLSDSLRTHFKTEEEGLWPHYEGFCGSLDAPIRRRLERRVAALESDIAANIASMSEYLQTKR